MTATTNATRFGTINTGYAGQPRFLIQNTRDGRWSVTDKAIGSLAVGCYASRAEAENVVSGYTVRVLVATYG